MKEQIDIKGKDLMFYFNEYLENKGIYRPFMYAHSHLIYRFGITKEQFENSTERYNIIVSSYKKIMKQAIMVFVVFSITLNWINDAFPNLRKNIKSYKADKIKPYEVKKIYIISLYFCNLSDLVCFL